MKPFTLIAAVAGILSISSCSKNKQTLEGSRWIESYSFYEKSRIDTLTLPERKSLSYTIKREGDNMVFKYSFYSGMYGVDDHGYGGGIAFQVAGDVNSFSYNNEELQQHLTHYSGGGAWTGYPDTALNIGTISGQKIGDGKWKVNIDVTLPRPDDFAELSRIQNTSIYVKGN